MMAPKGIVTLQPLRDSAILALLAGCGLRRSELAALTIDQWQLREGRRVIIDLTGKGGRVRVQRWLAAVGIQEGHICRPNRS
jgi:integrase